MTTAVAAVSNAATSNIPSSQSILQNYITHQQTAAATASATASNAASATSSAASASTGLSGNFNTFLKILTTQLQNQDPTQATDTNAFTQELVQFSGVEQQINTNAKLDTLISANNPNGITPLLGYVGQTVEATAANNQIVTQNGVGNFAYTLPATAQTAVITVTDSAGNAVATMKGTTAAGINRVSWDGKSSAGVAQPDGLYTIAIAATDSTGKAITPTNIKLIGVVTGVQSPATAGGASTLSIGSASVLDTAVDAVFTGVSSGSSTPPATTPATTTPTASTTTPTTTTG